MLDNGVMRAIVHLPHPTEGFYRGTRFDWAGIISSLVVEGREWFGPWRDIHDPLRHDCISGPAEEFVGFPDSDIDYSFVKPGGVFLRMGVGLLRKPDDTPFERFHTYSLVDPGLWSAEIGDTSIQIRHQAQSPTGLAYIYEKTIRLLAEEPTLLLEHRLENIGNRPIQTYQYNHNFFRFDGLDPGCDLVLNLPFDIEFTTGQPELLRVSQNGLSLIRPLTIGESLLTELTGFPRDVPYLFDLHHRITGAEVKISSDRPLARLFLWATRKTFCPEPYIELFVAPGCQSSWTFQYDGSVLRSVSRGGEPL